MVSALASRPRGTMLWFNAAKDVGALRTAAGDRIVFPGSAFAPGEKPAERCAGREVDFQQAGGSVSAIAFVPEPNPRRARKRNRR